MTNTMLDPNSRLTLVNTLLTERRRDAAEGRLARMATRAKAEAGRPTEAVRPSAPAGEVPAPRPARAVGEGS